MLEIRTPPHVKNTVETINNKKLYNTLRKRFVENFEIYQSINTERMEFTTTRKKPNGEELLLTNTIATEYFSKIKIERDITYEDINCPVYSTAVTLKLHLNDVNKRTVRSDNKQSEPKWMTQPTEKNKRIRKNLPHIELVQKCKQKKILHRLRRKYGNTKHQTLIYHAELLKYELKATSTRLTYQKKTEQKWINKQLANNPRNVYWSFWRNSTDIKETPAQKEVEKYWNDIWDKQGNFNNDAPWIRTLENEYCANTQPCENSEITINGVNDAISKLQDIKSPVNDLIVGYWYKHLKFYRNDLDALFNRTLNSIIEIPS